MDRKQTTTATGRSPGPGNSIGSPVVAATGRLPPAVAALACLFLLPGIFGCVNQGVDQTVGEIPDATADQQTAGDQGPPNNSYASAMQRHKPLRQVKGNFKAIPSAESSHQEFAAARAYAKRESSYNLLIWHRGQLVLEEYFSPYDSSLRPESASMHKSVVGLLTAAAIADGYLDSADDPIGRYIPQWANDARGDIRIRHLLTMTSGLMPLDTEGGTDSEAYQFWVDGPAARQTLLGMTLQHEPGDVFHYQDTVPQLLVMVLEAATGTAYTNYLSERLWQRIEAADAYVWLNTNDGFPRGYTALLATASDWLRLGLLIKNRGRAGNEQVISAALIDKLTAPSPKNPNYGWLTWRGSEHQALRYYNATQSGFNVAASAAYDVGDFVYFDCFGGQRVYISRSEDLVIVRQGALRPKWDDAILPNLVLKALDGE